MAGRGGRCVRRDDGDEPGCDGVEEGLAGTEEVRLGLRRMGWMRRRVMRGGTMGWRVVVESCGRVGGENDGCGIRVR